MARGGRAAAASDAGTDREGRRTTPVALTIAGSDSGGGAGIQADLKAFARCGVHGACAITAITAQNTLAVTAIQRTPPEIVLAQVRAVLADIGVDAVKVGMLGSVEVTLAVAQALDELPTGTPVVVDPVMVAESGARLLDEGAQRALIAEIVPRASVLTPNLPEARVLAGLPPREGGASSGEAGQAEQTREMLAGLRARPARAGEEEAKPENEDEDEDEQAYELARALLALGPGAVVLTGGHRARAVDLLLERAPRDERDGRGETAVVEIPGERHRDGAAHGSGCTHSAVLAARLALGDTTLQAAQTARRLAGEAVAQGLRDVGSGAGPVDVLGLERIREC